MNNKTNFIIISFLAIFFIVMGCSDNKALFDELSGNRLKIILKGTYESNGTPLEFNAIRTTDPLPDSASLPAGMELYDDSIYLLPSDDEPITSDDYRVKYPTKFMIDISHMNLNKHEFAVERQAITFSLDDSDPFFKGTGVQLKNDDPKHLSRYSSLRLYTRKMLFDQAREYEFGSSGWDASTDFSQGLFEVYFKEKKTQGYDFNLLQLNSFYDSLRLEASSINRVYPVSIPILGGFTFNRNYESMVLEVRLIIKNYIKKYETTSSRDSVTRVVHFWGFSDWLRGAEKGEYDLGRNLIAVARCYVPELVGTISGINSTGRRVYVIAIPAGDPITKYTLVNPALTMNDNGTINDITDDICTISTTHNFLSPTVESSYVARAGDIIEINSRKEYIVDLTENSISFFSTNVTLSSPYTFTVYPASNRRQNPCDLPVKPKLLGESMSQYLDYYQNWEEYRSDFNTAYQLCDNASYLNPFEYYKEAWLNYEESVSYYYLPPLAVYVPIGSSFTIDNVMPGDYDIYVTNIADPADDSRYGKLFYSNEFSQNDSTTVIPVPTVTVQTGQDISCGTIYDP